MNQLLCIALALFVGLLSSRLMKLLKLPNVTGYLIAGIIFGPFVLGKYIGGWSNNADSKTYIESVKWISDIALGFIAFTIGCSFKKEALQHVGKRVIIITICEALGGAIFTMGGLFLAKIFLKDQMPVSLILTFGAIACATAPAATLMVVRQYNAKGPVVDTLIPVVAFDDAVALIAFAVLFSISKSLSGSAELTFSEVVLYPLLEIVLSLALGTVLGILISLGCKLFKSRANRSIMVICSVFIVVGLSALSNELGWKISFSSLLACMMIGAMLINLRSDASKLIERIDGITPPLYILFFVISGASLNITKFAEKGAGIMLIIAGIYIIFRCLGKWCGSYISCKKTNAEPAVQKYLGFTLFPQAGVAIGLATTAYNSFPVRSQGDTILAVILFATIVYELVGPVITKISLKKAGEINE